MSVPKETIEELHKLILEQTNDLWLIAAGLIAFQALLIAHLVYSLPAGARAKTVTRLVSASTVSHALSLMFGYFAKGALIQTMIGYSKSGIWAFDPITGWMNLLQMVFVTIGLAIFIFAFLAYSRILAEAVVKGAGK